MSAANADSLHRQAQDLWERLVAMPPGTRRHLMLSPRGRLMLTCVEPEDLPNDAHVGQYTSAVRLAQLVDDVFHARELQVRGQG